ncbi:TPA: RecQ family ATP-dependent DNA helicase [Acinetobacter baumannii]|nr:RecQ family ATP-dependent DNA helicase [Acinetobacter baumannii]
MQISQVSLTEALDLFYKKDVWIDLEIDPQSEKLILGGLVVADIDHQTFYALNFSRNDLKIIIQILGHAKRVCGHNILAFDLLWLKQHTPYHLSIDDICQSKALDTLLLTILIFPHQPSHSLLKLYKVKSTINDPIYDCIESYHYYQRVCKTYQEGIHPQLVEWIEKKLPFSNILPKTYVNQKALDYGALIPQGQNEKFINWMNALPNQSMDNLGAIVFAHWLLHLEQPTCRRPTWLQDISDFGEKFTQAEKVFWNNQQFTEIDFDQESKDFFGFELRAGQKKTVHQLAQARSIPMGLLPTGGGKSLTFQLPALILSKYRRELTVIISPLKALMEDQVIGLSHTGHWGNRAACLISGQTEEEQAKILEGVWSGTIDLLYISPERLRTFTIQTLLSRRRPALWVVDEAHTIVQWGNDFRPDFLRIGRLIAQCYRDENATAPQLMLVTATAAQRVIDEIDKEIVQPLHDLIGLPLETVMVEKKQRVWRDNIQAEFIQIERSQRLPEIRKVLSQIFPNRNSLEHPTLETLTDDHPVALIYVRSRSKTEEFAQELRKQGFIAQAYHAGMSSNDKQRILEQFKMHQLDVVICTNAFGMGIDRANIHTVIHYSPPHNLESYLQEIGRAARKIGEKGRAILYWSQTDLDQLVQQNIDSQIGGHKVLLECWQQVIANVLKREKVSDRWFTAQELQTFLSFEGEELVTQIRVILLALEKYNLLVEKEHLPALLSLKLIDAPASTEGQAAELYRRLVPLIQQNDSQLYLPEISVALGLNVKSLLRGIRQLVKLGCARWACEVRIRLSKRHALLQRQLKYKRDALVALEDCWSMYEPDEIERIDLRALDQWFAQHNKQIKSREIFYIFKYFKILKIKENKYSLRVSPINLELSHWRDWIQQAKKQMDELAESLDLVFKYTEDTASQTNPVTQLLKIEVLVDKECICPEQFLQNLEYMQSFGWLNVSRLDDEAQKIFFIDRPIGEHARKRFHSSKDAYQYLEKHYQDRNRRLHILNHWLSCDLEVKKHLVEDYFNLDIEDVCEKYLSDPDLSKQAHLENFEQKIFPKFLTRIQREIISDDQRRAMLIIAGPGSGKTMIIVHRVANLIMCCNISAEKILILAYNRQAVFEVRQRLIQLIGYEYAAQVNIFTFHGLARHLTNISENQAPPHRDNNYKYQWLLEQAVEYLQDNPQFFQYILVDEFQDIDDVQYSIISHLAGLKVESDDEEENDIFQRGYLVAVGDDDQNLYGFRGANIQYIRNFQKDFQIAEEDIFYLIDNFRSPKDIVQLANSYIQNMLPACERLKTDEHAIRSVAQEGRQESGNLQLVLSNQSMNLDAIKWMIKDIQDKQASSKCDWSNFVILAREWSELFLIQHCLIEAKLNFHLLNQQNDLDFNESLLIKRFIQDLQCRPALDIIEGNPRNFAVKWVEKQGFSQKDFSFKRLMRRLSVDEKDLTCQQLLDLLLIKPDSGMKNLIILSTYHSSKGCEYDHVYILDRKRQFKKIDDTSSVRAMYVALTRAKKSLTLIQSQEAVMSANNMLTSYLQLYSVTINPPAVPLVNEITYYEQLGLADIYLSYPEIITEKGRNNIQKLAYDNDVHINQDFSIEVKRYNQKESIFLKSKKYGLIGKLSSNCISRLKKRNLGTMKLECISFCIMEYYQADRSFYEKAGYFGLENKHHIVIPFFKITQQLSE